MHRHSSVGRLLPSALPCRPLSSIGNCLLCPWLRGVLTVMFLVLTMLPADAASAPVLRMKYLGSSLIAMPTAFTCTSGGFISDDSHAMGFYSQRLLGRFLEFSALYHNDGAYKGKNILNLKANILDQGTFMPAITFGVSDYKETLGSKVFYFAASKTLDVFGATIHGGFIRDPVSNEKRTFFGIEKTIFPLIAVIGERFDDDNTFGIRLNPYPGVSIECARRYLDGDTTQQTIHRIFYQHYF